MKYLVFAGLLAVAASAQATNVGVSIGISQPGVYGRVDIGRFPQPAVVVAQPVLVQAPRMVVAQPVEPVYLWVPPGHRRNWRRHCAQYGACGVPVMFVQDRWYHENVHGGHARRDRGMPPPRQVQHEERGHGHGHWQDHGRGPGWEQARRRD